MTVGNFWERHNLGMKFIGECDQGTEKRAPWSVNLTLKKCMIGEGTKSQELWNLYNGRVKDERLVLTSTAVELKIYLAI